MLYTLAKWGGALSVRGHEFTREYADGVRSFKKMEPQERLHRSCIGALMADQRIQSPWR